MAVLSDPIADFLTRFKNASNAGNETMSAPFSKIKAEIARVLKEEGYIWNYEITEVNGFSQIDVKLRYTEAGNPVLRDLKRMSKPGLRMYVASDNIPRVLSGLGISIISTSQGLMTGAKARRKGIGGELIAKVW